MSSTKKIVLPITACCLVLVAIGVVVGWYLHNKQNDDITSDDDTTHHQDAGSQETDGVSKKSLQCTVCGDTKHRSTFYEMVFEKYLARADKKKEEIEYGHRCNGNLNEHMGISCGADGICWRIEYNPQPASNFEPKPNLKEFVDQEDGDWNIYGNSKGCLVNAHSHKWEGEELLDHAVVNAPGKRLKDVMFQNQTHIITIHFCKFDDCNDF